MGWVGVALLPSPSERSHTQAQLTAGLGAFPNILCPTPWPVGDTVTSIGQRCPVTGILRQLLESRLNGAKQPGVPSLTRLLSHASSIQRQSDGKKALRWNAHCKTGPATPGLARLHRMR